MVAVLNFDLVRTAFTPVHPSLSPQHPPPPTSALTEKVPSAKPPPKKPLLRISVTSQRARGVSQTARLAVTTPRVPLEVLFPQTQTQTGKAWCKYPSGVGEALGNPGRISPCTCPAVFHRTMQTLCIVTHLCQNTVPTRCPSMTSASPPPRSMTKDSKTTKNKMYTHVATCSYQISTCV